MDIDGVVGVFVDPTVVDVADGDGVQVIPPEASLFLCDDKSGFFEHAEVLHHGTAVELFEMRADVAGGHRVVAQKVEDIAAAAVGQSLVNEIIFFRA